MLRPERGDDFDCLGDDIGARGRFFDCLIRDRTGSRPPFSFGGG